MRLGRRDPDHLRVGDALDFWRVEELRRPVVLRLRAEIIPASGGAVSAPLVEADTTTDLSRAWGTENVLLEPSWSPDGTRIAYHTLEVVPAAELDGNGFRVHVMHADGSNDQLIEASPESDDEWGALWAPDGRSLAFQALDADPGARNEGGLPALDVAVVTVDGDATTIERLGPVAYLQSPRDAKRTSFGWAPDASTVLAAQSGAGTMTFDLDTGAPTMLSWHADGVPSWQPVIRS
jgi:Tol biopolymer transport system component